MDEKRASAGTLEYGRPQLWREGRLARWVGRVPEWVIALVLVLPVCGVGTAGAVMWRWGTAPQDGLPFLGLATIFAAGAVRWMRWRQLVPMVVLGLLSQLVSAIVWESARGILGLWLPVVYYGVPMLVLASAESLLTRPHSSRALAWSWLMGLGACGLLASLDVSLGCLLGLGQNDSLCGGYGRMRLAPLVGLPIVALVGWSAVHAARWPANDRAARWRWITGSVVATEE